jgi:alpha-amylase
MRTISLIFNVHQPFRLRRYRFFDIGREHYYYDDYSNESIMNKVANRCYLPSNKILKSLFKEYGCNFKVAFSISGSALDQFEIYAPEVLESFQELTKFNCTEFTAETYSHSLAFNHDSDEFENQIKLHAQKIEKLFGQKPLTFRNTELIYSDSIGKRISEIGFNTILTEGAKHILGWKSPNYLYCSSINPKLKVLLRNPKLSDDISLRFPVKSWDEYPLTSEKYVSWLNAVDKKEEVINLFMDYETFGEHQDKDTGIFEFLKAFPKSVFKNSKFTFSTPSEVAKTLQPVAPVSVVYPISWADEEKDLTAWLGNDLQQEAFNKLYELTDSVKLSDDPKIQQDWKYLQSSDHFYYMCTKFFSDSDLHKHFNPYTSPYDAFLNYMNILSDFSMRVKKSAKISNNHLISNLKKELEEKNEKLEDYEKEIQDLLTAKDKKINAPSKKEHETNMVGKEGNKPKSSKKVSKDKDSPENSITETVKTTTSLRKKEAKVSAGSGKVKKSSK